MIITVFSKKHGEKYFIIDDEDFDKIKDYKWYVHLAIHDTKYYIRSVSKTLNGKRKTILLHRTIMNCPENKVIDHINGDTLDNRKCNLRICNQGDNVKNASKRKDGKTSKFKGVSWSKSNKKFKACISIDKQVIHLGFFYDAVEAAKAYNKAAKIYHGEFAFLNQI
jgi:hypothetical protein